MTRTNIRATYYLEAENDLERAAAAMAGEQSSGTFVAVPGESPELHRRHGADVVTVERLGSCRPSLPSRDRPDTVEAAVVTVDFPLENIDTDLATLQTAIAGNLFELGQLYACRLQDLRLPDAFVAAQPGPAFGI
ncbi:MAG: hypothetical protein ABWX96_21650, partial [Propionibacteriaceae bacterium]